MRDRRIVLWNALGIAASLAVLAALGPARASAAACTDTVGPSIPPPVSAPAGSGPGYHARFYGQSGYLTLCPGRVATATVAFLNSGSLGWYQGIAGQAAYLGTSGPEPGQDRPSILGGDGSGGSPATGWPRADRPAAQQARYVGPGQVAWFQFTIKAPALAGQHRIGVRPLIEGTQWLEDYGVFWLVTVESDDPGVPPLPPPPTAARTYLPRLDAGVRSIRVPALLYHYVDWLPPAADVFRRDLTVSPTDFEQHLAYLRAQGYTAVTSSQLWWTLDQGGALPERPVQLTFDDGHVDHYGTVLPLLKKYGLAGTFFIAANLVGREGYLTRDMVRALADAGMDVQSHAVDHVSLGALPPESQRYQACVSRRILSEWTGRDVRHFAYPAGGYDESSFTALASCGYLTAYWTAGGSRQASDRMLLLHRERVRGQRGLAALLTALSR